MAKKTTVNIDCMIHRHMVPRRTWRKINVRFVVIWPSTIQEGDNDWWRLATSRTRAFFLIYKKFDDNIWENLVITKSFYSILLIFFSSCAIYTLATTVVLVGKKVPNWKWLLSHYNSAQTALQFWADFLVSKKSLLTAWTFANRHVFWRGSLSISLSCCYL